MKHLIHLTLLLLVGPFFAQDLFFEQSNGTTNTFGQIDVLQQSNNNLRDVALNNPPFNKTEGWELLAVDGSNYYYQITNTSSSNYGQIDIWNNNSQTRSNYGNLSSIFNNPTNWTLGGAYDDLLYFSSSATNSEIVSWDGTSTKSFAFLRDFLAAPQFWKLAGFHKGIMYVEWTNPSNFAPSIKTWDGTSEQSSYDNTDYYNVYNDAYLFGVSDFIISSNTALLSELEKVKQHILGTDALTIAQLGQTQSVIESDNSLFGNNFEVIKLGLEIIALYESNNGALFTRGTTTLGGYKRTASGFELENLILEIMQSILDFSYTETNLLAYPQLFNNTLFKTSSFFPGAVQQPANPTQRFTVQINGTHVEVKGTQANYETEDARRPTGCYLAPGSIAKITVPSSLVGIGASILVGAHTWDLTNKPDIKRMNRVSKKYEINNETITIANPLGGGIYINVPYRNNLGILDITLENVVRSPYYANTVANKTSLNDWQNVERLRDVPWTDLETDKSMIQVPTSWIYALDDPETPMQDWDLSMDAISELLGRPTTRSKTVFYAQVDVIIRGSANFPGYPQSNVTYNPYTNYNGKHNNYLINGPRNERGASISTFFHEQGHAEKIYKFTGEIESFVNFLSVAVYNKKFDVELNEAFSESFWGINHTIDEAAISWMITQNFREGNQMSSTTGQFRQEFSYQLRGHGKYVDMVRLFGWDPIEQFYSNTSESYDNGLIDYSNNVNNVPKDDRILRMSEAAGYDLRPLIHFWGIHPNNFNNLASQITASGVNKSTAIYDLLTYYKTIIPMNNTAFRNFGLNDFSQNAINNSNPFDNVSQSYRADFFKQWWNGYDNTEAQTTVNEVQRIIDLYFPEGRPIEHSTCFEISPISVEASSSSGVFTADNTLDDDPQTRWAANGNGQYLIYDLGDIYDLCDLEIDFQNSLTRLDYFDVEVSRDNKTYAPVHQSLTNSMTTNSYDNYSLSRQARYVKIICRGNENDNWNSIRDVKIYSTEEVVTSTNHSINSNEITVFPSPTKSVLNINGFSLENSLVNIYDLNGSLVQPAPINSDNSSIDTSSLENGVYIIKIDTGNNRVVRKFTIAK